MFDIAIAAPHGVLDRARAARDAERAAAAELLVCAVEWGELHPCGTGETPAGWGAVDLHGEGVLPLAGRGAPLVAEFAPLTLAAHLGLTPDAGRRLMADALELKYRLPRLWNAVVHDLAVPSWRARQVAELTGDLNDRSVAWVDERMAAAAVLTPNRLTRSYVRRTVREAEAYDDPDRHEAEAVALLDDRHVRLVPDDFAGPETTEVHMRLDTVDAEALEARLSEVAACLGELGDPDGWEVRKAKAVGVLADPQHAIALITKSTLDPSPRATGGVHLVLHLTPDDDLARVEGRGTTRVGRVRQWLDQVRLGGGRVTVRPVIDLATASTLERAVDVHDPPSWMREAALLRDDTCCFPSCTRSSRHSDLDHIEPYVPVDQGGPPGQTRLGNLAPLCRRHHRLKTHAGWTYQRLAENQYVWTTPTGDLVYARTQRRTPDDAAGRQPASSRPAPAGSRRSRSGPSVRW